MLFALLKLYARFALLIFCRKIVVNKPSFLDKNGPILFAANHPNSFLDGIILTTLFKEPVYSLARGDAFKNKKVEKLLRWLHLLPVYRTSEGVENLSHNYTTFAACQEVFAKEGIVLIFSEGRCVNEWHLRPLKKGTARLAISTWQKGIDLKVVPLGFNYSSFRRFGKTVHLLFGEALEKEHILNQPSDGKSLLLLNEKTEDQLKQLVYEIQPGDKDTLRNFFPADRNFLKTFLLFIPAGIGCIVHAPFYYAIKKVADKKMDNDHYDSVLTALLMLTYPVYWFLFIMVSTMALGAMAGVATTVLMPFSAWAFVEVSDDTAS